MHCVSCNCTKLVLLCFFPSHYNVKMTAMGQTSVHLTTASVATEWRAPFKCNSCGYRVGEGREAS